MPEITGVSKEKLAGNHGSATEGLLQDLRYTLRTLRRDAGFTAFAILIIGLGIGASSTVFSVLNTLLVRPLPFKDSGSLVWIANKTTEENDLSGQTVQVGRLLEFRERDKSFSDVAGYFASTASGIANSPEPARRSASAPCPFRRISFLY
jgi:hypothetical protein